jgi:hypothetical protein
MMVTEKYVPAFWLTITVVVIGVMILAWSPLPTQAGPELPPRATPTPTPRPDAQDDSKDGRPIGAYLDLHVQGASQGVWTVVQWQNSVGDWEDVTGWQGTLDTGHKTWWVAQADFGKGPFRWAVYQGQGGKLLVTSEAFYLPDSADAMVKVELSLAP